MTAMRSSEDNSWFIFFVSMDQYTEEASDDGAEEEEECGEDGGVGM